MTDFRIPKFENEDDEARWWFEHQDLIADEFEKAAGEGRLKRGGIRRLFAERGIPFPEPMKATIELDGEDLVRTQRLAKKRGLDCNAYLQELVHAALEKAEQEQAQSSATS